VFRFNDIKEKEIFKLIIMLYKQYIIIIPIIIAAFLILMFITKVILYLWGV